VLLVTGDPERGAIITPQVAEQARELNGHLEVVRLTGVGHNIHRGRLEAFVRTVRGFLGQRDAPA
jgi:N-formylmaleamate deformylase